MNLATRSRIAIMPLRAKLLSSPKMFYSTDKPGLPEIKHEFPPGDAQDLLFTSQGIVRFATLNRPKALNALDLQMVKRLDKELINYSNSNNSRLVIFQGNGRAFCAGGDIRLLAGLCRSGHDGQKIASEFFRKEYILNHCIGTFNKPIISIMDGITMGGGVGLSIHAPFRIATENTLFAMPESTIGFFPDVGGTFFLPRMDGKLGIYLGLTSHRLKGYDVFLSGIATHYVPSSRLDALREYLVSLQPTMEPPNDERFFSRISDAIEDFSEDIPVEYKSTITKDDRLTIDKAFSHTKLKDIISELETINSEFAIKTRDAILARSPTSCKVFLKASLLSEKSDFANSLQREAVIASRFMDSQDFIEGVRCQIELKGKESPQWDPPTLSQVDDVKVNEYFEPLSDQPPLEFNNDKTFTKYPHHFGLPTEQEIGSYITGEDDETREYKATRQEVIQHFNSKFKGKKGVEYKLNQVLDRRTVPDSEDATLLDWVYE